MASVFRDFKARETTHYRESKFNKVLARDLAIFSTATDQSRYNHF